MDEPDTQDWHSSYDGRTEECEACIRFAWEEGLPTARRFAAATDVAVEKPAISERPK